jgi:hypothetical protein
MATCYVHADGRPFTAELLLTEIRLTEIRARHQVSACFFGGHLMSGSKRPEKSGSEVRRRGSMAAVRRCG